MNGVNKTLYIPLYGKASVSKKGIILYDAKAEEIWEKEGFELKGKAKSKWLTYYIYCKRKRKKSNISPWESLLFTAFSVHDSCGVKFSML